MASSEAILVLLEIASSSVPRNDSLPLNLMPLHDKDLAVIASSEAGLARSGDCFVVRLLAMTVSRLT